MNNTKKQFIDEDKKMGYINDDTLAETNSELPKIKPKKIDPIGIQYYGNTFEGYVKMDEIRDLVPAFKDLYYEMMIVNPNSSLLKIIKEFNERISPRKFHPYPKNISQWKVKWDNDILAKKNMKMETIKKDKEIYQVIKTRNDEMNMLIPGYDDIESGVQTLGGELLNDAYQMLRDDQMNEEAYDDEVLVKRRNYIVGVFSHVTKMVQGKASLLLKASAEKRDNASFLMDMLAKASSGNLKEEDINFLKSSIKGEDANVIEIKPQE